MGKRYDKKSITGVIASEDIFVNDFDWIFRRQDAVDVGIDAFVEQSIDGDPKGKFIALQIKSGKGNFAISKTHITYYISNVHYNYWLNFDIPVILIAYFPDSKKTYWQQISKKLITKTKMKWKLVIPFENVLNLNAKEPLTKLLTNSKREYQTIKVFKGERIDDRSLYHLGEKTGCITDANEALGRIIGLTKEMDDKMADCNIRIMRLNNIGQSLKSPEAEAIVWRLSKSIIILSKRMENEIQIFAETFTEGIFGFGRVMNIYYNLTGDYRELINSKESLLRLPNALDNGIESVDFLKKAIKGLPNAYHHLNEAKSIIDEVLGSMLFEYKEAKQMVLDVNENW